MPDKVSEAVEFLTAVADPESRAFLDDSCAAYAGPVVGGAIRTVLYALAEARRGRGEAIRQRDALAAGDFPLWIRLLSACGGDVSMGRADVVNAVECMLAEAKHRGALLEVRMVPEADDDKRKIARLPVQNGGRDE